MNSTTGKNTAYAKIVRRKASRYFWFRSPKSARLAASWAFI